MSEEIDIQIPEEVKELLEPISSANPCGADIANDGDYFKLSMEIGKTTPDYKLCVELGTDLLKEKSKDLWVASWLCFAWFRSEKLVGFRNGITVLSNLLVKFGNELYPIKELHKSKAIQFLNSNRFYKLLEKVNISSSNAGVVTEIGFIFEGLSDECKKQFGENAPVLKLTKQVIDNHLEKAHGILRPPKQEEKPVKTNATEKKEQPIKKSADIKNEVPKQNVPPKQAELPSSAVAEPKPISSSNDAVEAIKESLLYFFDDKGTHQEPPTDAFIYGISRTLQWGRLSLPIDNATITQIVPPNRGIQNGLNQVVKNKQWDRLISGIEKNFLIDDSGFMYWLDTQRYVVNALEMKGSEFLQAANEIKIQLAKLLLRYPNINNLKFNDGKTSFANSETSEWINSEVNIPFEKGETKKEELLPPIMGEEYEQLNQEYKSACEMLPDKFEENFSKLQKNIEGDTRRKGRFLRTLNLANYCIECENFQLAEIYLADLVNKIEEYNLVEWEPSLCVAVWQSQYIVFAKSNHSKDKNELINKKEKLFHKIAKYNGILAMKLNDHI